MFCRETLYLKSTNFHVHIRFLTQCIFTLKWSKIYFCSLKVKNSLWHIQKIYINFLLPLLIFCGKPYYLFEDYTTWQATQKIESAQIIWTNNRIPPHFNIGNSYSWLFIICIFSLHRCLSYQLGKSIQNKCTSCLQLFSSFALCSLYPPVLSAITGNESAHKPNEQNSGHQSATKFASEANSGRQYGYTFFHVPDSPVRPVPAPGCNKRFAIPPLIKILFGKILLKE